ncbi:MAG: COQ9 family protein [Pseudomonadota bacterium]
MQTPSYKYREQWLNAALPLVERQGWSETVVRQAASDAELDTGQQALAAPGGINDLIDHMFDRASVAAQTALEARDLSNYRTHEKVAEGLMAWLDALEPHREAVRKAAQRGVMPWAASAAGQQVWRTADWIWEQAGDTSDDYNRYTKRGLLSAVIPSAVTYWLEDPSTDALYGHITKRLQQAMRLGQMGSRVLGPILDRIPPRGAA